MPPIKPGKPSKTEATGRERVPVLSNATPFGGLEENYPNITFWVRVRGWIEIGRDGHVGAFVSALDDGGLVWEGEEHYETLDEAFRALEAGIAQWLEGSG